MEHVLICWRALWPLAACIVATRIIYKYILYPVIWSPLSKIPNAHWSASFSTLWILYVRFRGIDNSTLLDAHKKLGPVVRVGPNDLSINHIDYVRMVYGGGFDKSHWVSLRTYSYTSGMVP